jgi:osmotically-inducible protein OsmY
MQRMVRPLAAVALCGALAVSLQGCMGIVFGGAVMGTLAASDRRTLGAQTEDKAIVVKGESRISSVVGDAGHVNVNSFNRKVLLTGEVRDEAMKAAVAREAAGIEGVEGVVNEVEIMGTSSFSSRANDALITSKVKASLVDSKELYANAFKITTERGTVFLQGLVTQREGMLAANLASQVSGVSKVVKVFDYISDEEYKRLQNTADAQNAQGTASK